MPRDRGCSEERLALIIGELGRTGQGWVVTGIEAEDVVDRLRGEFVRRMMDWAGTVA